MFGWTQITCCNCKTPFAVLDQHHERLKADSGEWFYCPNGHRQHFTESETDKLRRERDRLAQQIVHRDSTIEHYRQRSETLDKRLSATKGVVTRIKNRVGAGVCPCCTRSFQNLANHMKSQHPQFRAEAAE
jgi:hypothetical protein